MPSAVRVDGVDEPKVKRVKLNEGSGVGGGGGSRIFTPFRVPWLSSGCNSQDMLTLSTLPDRRLGLSYCGALYLHSIGQDNLSNHDLRWALCPNLRSPERA